MPPRNYIDFKLYLTAAPDGKGTCQVALLPTPEVGEAITPINVAAEKAPKADLLAFLASKQITLHNLATLGKQLADCLLPAGPIRDLFRDAYRHAGEDQGVRLRLIIADHTLKQWPWEYVYLDLLGGGPDSMRGFLALNKSISVVRHEPLPFPHPAPSPEPAELTQLPMLIVAALPKGERTLDLDQEIKNIEGSVASFNLASVRIIPKVLKDATRDDLIHELLRAGSAYIFHFAGHGDIGTQRDDFNRGVPKESGYIHLLADRATKQCDRLSAEELARHLNGAGVRLAVLGACHSGARDATYPWDGVASALAANGIPAIIAMQYEVNDLQAIAFSSAFYGALGLGLSLDEATWAGRAKMLETTNTELDTIVNVEWGIPVLYSRLPDGALFPGRIKQSGASPAAEAFRKRFTHFEKKILSDQYALITALSARLERVMTNLNRLHSGQPAPEGFMKQNEIVPLTEIFEDLEIHRLVLGEDFYRLFLEQAKFALKTANVRSPEDWAKGVEEWTQLREKMRLALDATFGISKIRL